MGATATVQAGGYLKGNATPITDSHIEKKVENEMATVFIYNSLGPGGEVYAGTPTLNVQPKKNPQANP